MAGHRVQLPTLELLGHRRLTLLGRSIALISGELLANAACWVAAALCFRKETELLSLCLLAWTIGLRHGLDADHISAIDNATRQLVSLGQLPLTCGLWFSLGHSTIVIVVNIALAISVDIYDKLDKVGSVGGIIGASVSASFLFLIACINIYYLTIAIKDRRRVKALAAQGLPLDPPSEGAIYGGGCLVRIVAPLLRTVNRPWKMYPVGILFGFGFDTASSIALLGISAIAQRGANGESISHGKIVILPFLFTAGMSLVDSLDSVLMLYAYAAPGRHTEEGKLSLFIDSKASLEITDAQQLPAIPEEEETASRIEAGDEDEDPAKPVAAQLPLAPAYGPPEEENPRTRRILDTKANTMSSLSITLTLLSIVVALAISLITIMGLIGENCTPCREAAEAEDGGGLAGSWWRAWARAGDQSEYIGAAIVGSFLAIVLVYYGGRWGLRRWQARQIRLSS